MSYSITIGNADIDYDKEYESIDLTVEDVEHPDAPSFINNDHNQRKNGWHVGYGSWHDFTKKAGIEELFYGEDGLFSEHPGIAMLTEKHYAAVKEALDKMRATLPKHIKPGFVNYDKHDETGKFIGWMEGAEAEAHYAASGVNADLARLVWLEWWIRWALDNCKYPAMHNS